MARCPADGTELVSVEADEDLVGRVLDGKYELRRELGEGGMGRVYLAHQASMDRYVAVKVLHPSYARDKGAVQRFMREVRAASKLNHPNTIRIYDFGQSEDGLLFMVLEVLKGHSLADVLDKEGPLAPERAVHVALQIADALSEAHLNGIVHRDLKPDNIYIEKMFGNPEHVKVLDFGIAKMEEREATGQTEPGVICGTPTYMSPEQVQGGQIDGRADIYGLGALLFEMVSGTPPFTGESPFEVLIKHLNEPPPPLPERVARSVPVALQQLIARMLAKLPEERPQTCQLLREALKASLELPEPPDPRDRERPSDTLVFGGETLARVRQPRRTNPSRGYTRPGRPLATPPKLAAARAAAGSSTRIETAAETGAGSTDGATPSDGPPASAAQGLRESTPGPSPSLRHATPAPSLRQATPAPSLRQATPAPSLRQATPAPSLRQATPAPTPRDDASLRARSATPHAARPSAETAAPGGRSRRATPPPGRGAIEPALRQPTPAPHLASEEEDGERRSRRVQVAELRPAQPPPVIGSGPPADPTTPMRPTRVALQHMASGEKFDIIAANAAQGVLHCLSGVAPATGARMVLMGAELQFAAVLMAVEVLGPAPDVPAPDYILARWERVAATERTHHLQHVLKSLGAEPPELTTGDELGPSMCAAWAPVTGIVTLERVYTPEVASDRRSPSRRGLQAATRPRARTATPARPIPAAGVRADSDPAPDVDRPWGEGDE